MCFNTGGGGLDETAGEFAIRGMTANYYIQLI